MARDKGQEVAVIETAQDVTIGDSANWYTFTNIGGGQIFYRLKNKTTMVGTAAEIVGGTILGARLEVNEAVHIKGGTWEVVCGSDTGATATLRVNPGRMAFNLTADVNVGVNLGLLNKAEVEIDPSEGRASNVAFSAGDMLTPAGAVRKDTRALPETVADGDWVGLQTTLLGDLRVRDDDLVGAVHLENEAFDLGDSGITAMAVRADVRALPGTAADGDYTPLQTTTIGELRTRDDDANTDLDTLVTAVHPENGLFNLTDSGIAIMAIREDVAALPGTAADGDYTPLQTNATGQLRVVDDDLNTLLAVGTGDMASAQAVTLATDDTQYGAVGAAADVDGNVHGQLRYIGDNIDQVHIEVDDIDATADWSASTDASGLTQETVHVPDHTLANSLSIDKAAGTVVEASYGKTISAVDGSVLAGDALVTWFVKHINFTNVATVFVRLGTDSGNYNQYAFDPVDFSATLWNHITMPLHEGVQTGTGLNLSAITYVAFGVIMDASANTITEIFFNDVELHSINVSELQSGDITANTVRVTKVGSASGGNWPKNAGNTNDATPRMVLATDDVNTAAINVAVKNRDEVLSVTYRITVDQASDVFANQGGAALPAATTSIALIPEDDTVQITWEVDGTDADVNAPRLPATGIVIPITKATGDVIEMWIASGTEYVTLLVYIPR